MAFQSVTVITGKAVPLRRNNVDTDQIIPAVYMKRITRTGFEDGLFATWRRDPNFVLNRQEHSGASILIAGLDFGTGSSREHAVWALLDYGFRVVISPRFADIFRGNAAKSGLLAIQLSQDQVDKLWQTVESEPELPLCVDLNTQTIAAGDMSMEFAVDADVRWRLLNGLDDIDLTLQDQELIAAFEITRPRWLPTTKSKSEDAVQGYKSRTDVASGPNKGTT
ncbi:3-isopropylmalate dehydratase small subunit [Paenarthrobacter ureafaciens]|uniref:3-isopropylmalate dehydratase small subunit n=1 Tax=Paenarthrobacter ureafaciens TaxID=37931 RepID=UPI002DBD1160|nr:3-isopropylmalate dehydratase small subunit [Paenarthrobacter ureafaciens]MEC3853914.1 3-isopropylmalate dehydratase small subunit [Paenarthrobacter ureafaciens]